jgi:signal transduction histidine kinase
VEVAPHDLPVQLAARGVEMRDYEEEVVFDDGARLSLYGNSVPLYDREGRVRGAISAFVDITERKRAEEAIKEADHRKDEFLAMLAHELRNPLAPIRNAVQMLQRLGPPDPKLRWARDVIDRQAGHLARIVDDLLDLSRITQGKIALRKEKLELMNIIGRAVETSRPLIDARKHQWL